jgi:hypothetical protein
MIIYLKINTMIHNPNGVSGRMPTIEELNRANARVEQRLNSEAVRKSIVEMNEKAKKEGKRGEKAKREERDKVNSRRNREKATEKTTGKTTVVIEKDGGTLNFKISETIQNTKLNSKY